MRALLILFALASTAIAAPKVAVLEAVVPADVKPELAMLWTDVARGVVQERAPPGAIVLTRDNLEALLPPGVDLAECEGECEVSAGRNVGAEFVITLRVIREFDQRHVAVALFDTRDGVLLRHARIGVTGDPEAAVRQATRAALNRWAVEHQGGEYGPSAQGVAVLPAQTPSAPSGGFASVDFAGALPGTTFTIDGLKAPEGAARQVLRPGRHVVRAIHHCYRARPITIRLVAGEHMSLPLAALNRCSTHHIETNVPGATIEWGPGDSPLSDLLHLLPDEERDVEVKAPSFDPQVRRINARSPAHIRVELARTRHPVRVWGRHRFGDVCTAPLRVDGKVVGKLPWSGELTEAEHVFEADCGTRTRRVVEVSRPQRVVMRAHSWALEYGLNVADGLHHAFASMRVWTGLGPLGMRLFGGTHIGSRIDDADLRVALEAGLGLPIGQRFELIWSAVGGTASGMRLFGRLNVEAMYLDFGASAVDGEDEAAGLYLGAGRVF